MRRPEISHPPLEAAPTEWLGSDDDELLLGRYRLQRRIGAGGFGVVWRAHDERLRRDVAVTVITREGDDLEEPRVEREALAAARLNPPGIVALYEMGSDEDGVYLVSELVEGATLQQLSRDGALSDRDVARIGAALCDALEHAHARGVIHRDVKPANVMVLAEPAAGAGFAKLADFGIAQLGGGDTLTATGDVVGTLAYMAPEQAEGRRVTRACDVYSLALTLYEAWTGVNPIRAETPAATARRLGRPLPPLRYRRPDLPAALGEAVDAALDADPALRPDPQELRELLHEAQPELSDEGGLVEAGTIERLGLTRSRARTRLLTRLRGRGKAREYQALEENGGRPRQGAVPAGAERLSAGLAAGLLLMVGLETLGPAPPVSPFAAAATGALLVALLPRLGWLASALAVCGWLASPEAGQAGTALVVAAVLAPTPLLLPRAGLLWSLPAAAPLLGAVGLAPLFVALAGLATTAWRRAGLAAAGFLWLAVAEALTAGELLFGAPDGTLPRSEWSGSALQAGADALLPLVTSPAPAPLVVWVAFAVLLPVLVRGRFAAVDVVAAGLWGMGLVVAHGALGDLLAATTELDRARGALAGAGLGAVVAWTLAVLGSPVGRAARDPALP